MLLWPLGLALADPGVVIEVSDPAGVLTGRVEAAWADPAGALHVRPMVDDGTGPDRQAQDGIRTARLPDVTGPEGLLAIMDAAGQRWTGPFARPRADRALAVVPTPGGGLHRAGSPVPQEAAAPRPDWADPGSPPHKPAPWGLLVWAAGLGLASLALFWAVDPGVARGPGANLERVGLDGPRATLRFLADRARIGPLVIAGPAPQDAQGALVLGPGRVDVDDLLQALQPLEGRPQVAITGPLEGAGGLRGEAALVLLAERLPAEVDAFVLTQRP